MNVAGRVTPSASTSTPPTASASHRNASTSPPASAYAPSHSRNEPNPTTSSSWSTRIRRDASSSRCTPFGSMSLPNDPITGRRRPREPFERVGRPLLRDRLVVGRRERVQRPGVAALDRLSHAIVRSRPGVRARRRGRGAGAPRRRGAPRRAAAGGTPRRRRPARRPARAARSPGTSSVQRSSTSRLPPTTARAPRSPSAARAASRACSRIAYSRSLPWIFATYGTLAGASARAGDDGAGDRVTGDGDFGAVPRRRPARARRRSRGGTSRLELVVGSTNRRTSSNPS